MRFAVDTGGTFTDLVIEDGGATSLFKSPTTPDDPLEGVLNVLSEAATALGVDRSELLARGDTFIHGTTKALNAILTGTTARTALLTTSGHRDILVFREGGRRDPFNFTRRYPEPYVPRQLTFEVPERVGADGEVVARLDEERVVAIAEELRERKVEAAAVCLLWSIVNPAHELRVGEILADRLPDLEVTLSHQLNPSIREYRRAMSACLDASLKPVMSTYLHGLNARLREAGFQGRILVVTSNGGMLDAGDVAAAPVHSINSGPAMAPIAGGHYAGRDVDAETAVIADTGGTSYDVSVIRDGRIQWTREMWLGLPYLGHMTGFPAVDVRSVGAGGGSIASVDPQGMLHVGPASAGAYPGPACYGRGGLLPTVTDAALALGYIDPDYFLGGQLLLDKTSAAEALDREVATPLGLNVGNAALAVMRLVAEHMVSAIEDVTLQQGLDPRDAVLVAGGGAAGLNSTAIARRLGCQAVVFPAVGAALSAAGALMSDLTAEFAATRFCSTNRFDHEGVAEVLERLHRQATEFATDSAPDAHDVTITYSVEARYPDQIWELELPLELDGTQGPPDPQRLRSAFHELHQQVFAVQDPGSEVDFVTWRARVTCSIWDGGWSAAPDASVRISEPRHRKALFDGHGWVDARVLDFAEVADGTAVAGPALISSPVTTIVVDPGAAARRSATGSLVVTFGGSAERTVVEEDLSHA
jgi:N-methylhydantoinase A